MKLYTKSFICMDTVVSFHIESNMESSVLEEKMNEAMHLFYQIESACSRFSSESELYQLCKKVGQPVAVSDLLFQPLRFALEISNITNGVFDCTVGQKLIDSGFNTHYLTGEKTTVSEHSNAAYQDVEMDEEEQTVTLLKPLLLDLGAVAKGFAIDVAANVLSCFESFTINAGGDVFVFGSTKRVGIQHPLSKHSCLTSVSLMNQSICTSGTYERGDHIISSDETQDNEEIVSASVVAPFAMLADACSTVFFLLGPQKGIEFLEEQGLEGILYTRDLTSYQTQGWGELKA